MLNAIIDVRNAARIAQNYFNSLQDMIGCHTEGLRLEETELSEDRQCWIITLSFVQPINKISNPLADLIATCNHEREYKVFTIDATTGEVQSMKTREI